MDIEQGNPLTAQQRIREQERQYEDYEIQFSNQLLDQYEIMEEVGKGKFGSVYKAISRTDGTFVAIKVLIPVREAKIKREIRVLSSLTQCKNIIKLLGVTRDKCSNRTSFIFPFVHNKDIRDLPDQEITLPRIKKYIYQILQALTYAHELSIYHRDIKPQNILYNPETEQVLVGDWGLAQFHYPNREQSLKVGSRNYKAPELLLNNSNYDCAVDMWSLGCVLGSLVFYKSVLFRGSDNKDQIRAIASLVIGTEQIRSYVQKFNLPTLKDIFQILDNQFYPKKPWTSLIDTNYKQTATEAVLDLISKMLVVDHTQRISAKDALSHRFFTEQP